MLTLSLEELSYLRIPERISALEVAKKIRFPIKANILGNIDFSLTPYLRDPCSLIGNSLVEYIGAIAPTQSGKTVFLQVAVADSIDQDPGPMLYILPDEKAARKHMKEKVISVLEKSPELSTHLTGKKNDVSIQSINLDNMTIDIGWAGGLATMSSIPRKRVVWDEVRLMPLTIGQESNAIKLGGDRLTTYIDMKIGQGYMVSSPSVEGDLLHQQLSIPNTTVLFWHVPCLECGEYQLLDFFTHIKWNEKKEVAECKCQYCGAVFDDKDKKREWNAFGVYAPKDAKILQDGSLVEPYKITTRMFYRWSSLESPFRSFQRIWNEYIQTKDKIHDYKNFWQCWLARFWIDDISKTSIIGLKRQIRDDYSKRDILDGTQLITAGIDTQDNGFFVVFRGWLPNRGTYLLDEFFIENDMDTEVREEIIETFSRDIVNRVYTNPNNLETWKAALIGIDTGGHRTKMMYEVCSVFNNILMVKGRNNQNTTYSYNKELNLYRVRTCEYLQESETKTESEKYYLPVNVSGRYLNEFCNVRKVKNQNKKTGEETIDWKKVGRCDYRFADIHSYICLDIPTDRGEFRAELEKPGWKFNPIELEKEVADMRSESAHDTDDTSDYNVGNFDW